MKSNPRTGTASYTPICLPTDTRSTESRRKADGTPARASTRIEHTGPVRGKRLSTGRGPAVGAYRDHRDCQGQVKFALPRTRRWRQVVSGQTQEGYTDDARGYEMIDYFCTGRYFRSAWMWVSENTENEGWDGRSAMVPPVVSIPISGCVAMVSLWT